MKVIVPGHRYELQHFENKTGSQKIQFIHKEPTKAVPTFLETVDDGTTTEDVLEVLIDRVKFLQEKFPCKENAMSITHMEEALNWLEKRTRDRMKRNVEGKHIA